MERHEAPPPAPRISVPWMQEMADLYEACARIGLHRAEVREMEFWEVASELGLGREKSEPEDTPRDPAAGRDLVAERVAALREGRPPPTIGPPPPRQGDSVPSR